MMDDGHFPSASTHSCVQGHGGKGSHSESMFHTVSPGHRMQKVHAPEKERDLLHKIVNGTLPVEEYPPILRMPDLQGPILYTPPRFLALGVC